MTSKQTDLVIDVYEAAIALSSAWEQQEAEELSVVGSGKPPKMQTAFKEAKIALLELLFECHAEGIPEVVVDGIMEKLLSSELLARLS